MTKEIAHRLKTEVVSGRSLVADIRTLIESARFRAAQTINTGLVVLYWNVGHRIRTEVLRNKRADYGETIVQTVSKALVPGYGQGFGARNLWRMMRFVEVFPDSRIVTTLSALLGWSHFVEIIPYARERLT